LKVYALETLCSLVQNGLGVNSLKISAQIRTVSAKHSSASHPLMTNIRQERGQTGEDAAVRHVEALGYRIVARNWRPGAKGNPKSNARGGGMRGEVDIIAWHGKTLCFIEVKARSSNNYGAPQESVTPAKQRQLSRLANAYVSYHRLDVPCRFDVVEVWLSPNAAPRLKLHQNAFDYCG
jgi:putative endonuclease